jgi:NADH-quinone oxidoreductase subunit E
VAKKAKKVAKKKATEKQATERAAAKPVDDAPAGIDAADGTDAPGQADPPKEVQKTFAEATVAIGPIPAALTAELEELASHYPQRRAALIPALHRCQEELGGWLSPETLEACATFFGLEPVEVYGVASFYPMFHMRPVGKHVVAVCHNLSCAVRGAANILSEACRVTGCARPGATSEDGEFTVLRVECQGTCSNAPMFDLDGTYHENLDVGDVAVILGGKS